MNSKSEKTIEMNSIKLDIGSDNSDHPSVGKLSNFSEFHFIIDGVLCFSMEGFLQSLKFKELKKQEEICKLIGKEAKFKGQKKKWYKEQLLYWKGEAIPRESFRYQELLDQAFSELFKNDEYKKILKDTEDSILVHTIGKTNPKETVLTINEFCQRLMALRDYSLK